MWTHNDVVARYVFFLRTEIYYYSLLVSIKKFSPLLDWDSPISRWRARAFPSSPSLSLPLLHTLFLSLSRNILFESYSYSSFSLSRDVVLLSIRASVVSFFSLLFARTIRLPFLSLSLFLYLTSFVQRNEHTFILFILFICIYIYFFIYLFFIHTQTKPSPVSARESSVLGSFLSLFFCSLVVCSVLFFFFNSLSRVCICIYNMYV